MSAGPSFLSLVGSGLYLVVALACLIASATAVRGRQQPTHWQTWGMLAVLFGIFAMIRFFNLEDIARSGMRAYLVAEGAYGARRMVQAPLVALALTGAVLIVFALIYRWSRSVRGRRNVARVVAVLAVLAMLLLIALRLASLHAVDALLYGPLKLNWIIDAGASLMVLGVAAYYTKLVRERP